MAVRQVTGSTLAGEWNKTVTHPVESWEWGEFRKKTGLPVVRFLAGPPKKLSGFQLTIHKIPYTRFTIGYLPKCNMPTKEVIKELKKIGRKYNCIFIQIEPNIKLITNHRSLITKLGLRPSLRALFFKYTFVIDLTKSDEDLVAAMHPKTRYNIRIAQRHGARVEERTDDEAFKIFLKLYFETIKRQKYFGHTPEYHKLLWKTLKQAGIARLLIAYYKRVPLVAWVILKFKDTIYYPYGGSSDKYKNVMASNLVVWEAIKLGRKLGVKEFDLWGSLGPNASQKDPWYGFHRFKAGYGGRLVEYVGSYDLVFNPALYFAFHLIEKLRWRFLRIFH